jgi:cell division septation protein DedD
MQQSRLWIAAFACALGFASPAFADTRAGFELWNQGDFYGAVREWRPLAIAGDPVAQYDLAQAYKLGRGVPQDLKMAEVWYGRAAAQGHIPSRDNYGLMLFQNGDRAAAMPYIEESAARGEPRAQYVLGTALFNGDNRKEDWVRAYALMTRASAAGITAASLSLAQMDKYVPLEKRQQGLALARALEQSAAKPQAAGSLIGDVPPPAAPAKIMTEDLPPSKVGAPPVPTDAPAKTAKVDPPKVAKPKIEPKPAKPAAAPSGNWKVQLAAFGDAGKANALWSGLRAKIAALGPYRSFVTTTGPVTRLQAGPLPSRAAADALCGAVRRAGQACIPVAP